MATILLLILEHKVLGDKCTACAQMQEVFQHKVLFLLNPVARKTWRTNKPGGLSGHSATLSQCYVLHSYFHKVHTCRTRGAVRKLG